jgi:hypothetical protein
MDQLTWNLTPIIPDMMFIYHMTLTPVWPLTWPQRPTMSFNCQKYLLLQEWADFNQTLSEQTLTHASYRVFRNKESKVIKGVISGLTAKNCEKYSKNHCLYKLHGRVTSLAHMHCYQPGSSWHLWFWDQRSLRGHFRSKPKILKNGQKFLSHNVNIAE